MRRKPTFTRADRLEHLMTDEVERLLAYEVRKPMARQIKVVHAHLSPDLGHLRVQYVMVTGEEASAAIVEFLQLTAGFVARAVTESLQLRKKPQVAFHFDRDAMRSHRVEELLAEEKRKAAQAVEAEASEVKDPDEQA